MSGRWRLVMLALTLVLASACGEDAHDDELDDLVLADGTLEPPFRPSVLDYTAEVGNAVVSTTVTPTADDSDATVTVNGTSVASGSTSQPIGLAVGENTITIVVTADDGDARTYTVVVTRAPAPSDNPNLARLELTATSLDQIFDSTITTYTASIGHLGASTRVVAEPEERGVMELNGQTLDAGEASDPVPLPVGASTVLLEVTAEDGSDMRAYQVEVTRASRATLRQEAYLKASNTGPDNFGSSVGLHRNILVVGAPGEGSAASGVDGDETDNSLRDAGAAYVFERAGSTWVQAAYLKASSPGDPDRFGGAVAVHGNLALVGAEGEQSLASGIDGDDEDDSSSRVGAVYAFGRDGMGGWSQEAYLKASNGDQDDEFGRYLDVDGNRVIVGAWSEDSDAVGVDGDGGNDNRPGAGAAYLFGRDDAGRWRQEAYLKASNTGSGDEFGRAVGVSGDTAAVGAPFEDSSASGIGGDESDDSRSSTGAVYVFELDEDGDWSQSAYVKASNTDAGDRFGASLALDGNLLAVGAPGEDSGSDGLDGNQQDNSAAGAGAVYVFERDGDGVWSQIAYVKASNPDVGDGFGAALALSGNVLVVAAAGESSAAVGFDGDQVDDSVPDAGAVYVFERDGAGVWRQVTYVKASNTGAADEFGSAVAFHGDTLVVGARFEQSADTGVEADQADNSLNDAGATYVIR